MARVILPFVPGVLHYKQHAAIFGDEKCIINLIPINFEKKHLEKNNLFQNFHKKLFKKFPQVQEIFEMNKNKLKYGDVKIIQSESHKQEKYIANIFTSKLLDYNTHENINKNLWYFIKGMQNIYKQQKFESIAFDMSQLPNHEKVPYNWKSYVFALEKYAKKFQEIRTAMYYPSMRKQMRKDFELVGEEIKYQNKNMLTQKFDLPSKQVEPKQVVNSPNLSPNSNEIQEKANDEFQKIVITSKYGKFKDCQ